VLKNPLVRGGIRFPARKGFGNSFAKRDLDDNSRTNLVLYNLIPTNFIASLFGFFNTPFGLRTFAPEVLLRHPPLEAGETSAELKESMNHFSQKQWHFDGEKDRARVSGETVECQASA
jgi:hypothetical protein